MADYNEIIKKGGEEVILQDYIDPKIISERILEAFVQRYNGNEKIGFCLDGRTNRTGLISNCMALSTFLEIESMGASIQEHHSIVFDLVELIFASVYRSSGATVFDASPYIINSPEKKIELNAYTESVSKVLITMTDFRTYLIKQNITDIPEIKIQEKTVNNGKELIDRVEKLIIKCINCLNDSCLKVIGEPKEYKINDKSLPRSRSSERTITYRGWTFNRINKDEQDKYGTSLYFTYHATNAFLAFYQSFYPQFQKTYENEEPDESKLNETDKELLTLNSVFFSDNDSPIRTFRDRVISSGRYLEQLINERGINLALYYINKDIMPVRTDEILSAQKSNDVINTLFAMSILINAGLDDDYEIAGQKQYLYEQLQFGLTNVKKAFSIMKKSNSEDSIDSYHMLFDESCPKDARAVTQELRKMCDDVAVYDFIPLFCNTYSVISQYLIRYPQKEMVDNLKMIMENRMDDRWLWSKERFDINNNLYYIFALENFYEYWRQFEFPFSEWGVRYNNDVKKAQEERENVLKTLAERNKELEDLHDKYNEKQSALDKEVSNIADKVIEKRIKKDIGEYLQSMIDEGIDCALEVARKVAEDSSYAADETLFRDKPSAELLHKLLLAPRFKDIAKSMGDKAKKQDQDNVKKEFKEKLLDEICNQIVPEA